MMAEEHIGSLVSVDCGSTLGVYDGHVIQVDSVLHTLTLKDPKRNGVVYPVPKVTLRAADIHDLKILKLRDETALDNDNGYQKSPKKFTLHHSKSFQNNSKSNKASNNNSSFRRSQTPDPPNCYESSGDEHNGFRVGESAFNEYPGNGCHGNSSRRNNRRGNYANNYTPNSSNFYLNDKDCVLAEELDFSAMEDDFDFEANLAMFHKLDVKQDSDGQPHVERPKKNIGHDEFVLQNPTDVYCNAKKVYKYRTEHGSQICSVTANNKRQIFEKFVSVDSKCKDRFVHVYSMTILGCLYDILGSKSLDDTNVALVNLNFGDSESESYLTTELSNDIRIHLENRSVRVYTLCCDAKMDNSNLLHSRKFDIVLLLGGCAALSMVNFSIEPSAIVLFVETGFPNSSQSSSSTVWPSINVKSLIFWQFPVSDCEIKSNSIYLCDTGLNPNMICEKLFELKKYQDPFGARFFTHVLKM